MNPNPSTHGDMGWGWASSGLHLMVTGHLKVAGHPYVTPFAYGLNEPHNTTVIKFEPMASTSTPRPQQDHLKVTRRSDQPQIGKNSLCLLVLL